MGAEEKNTERFANIEKFIKEIIEIHEENSQLRDAEIRYKELVESLEEKMKSYRLIMENLPQRIYTKDKEFRYFGCNERYARNLERTPDEILGKQDPDFFPPEIAEKYQLEDKSVLEGGEIIEREERFVCEGKETIAQTVKVPIKTESGAVEGILGISWDITHSKEKEEELTREIVDLQQLLEVQRNGLEVTNRELQEQRASTKQLEEKIRGLEEDYQILFENIGTPVVLIDGNNLICMANPEFVKFSGYSNEELKGQKKWNEFLVNEGQERMNELLSSPEINSVPPGPYECAFVDKHDNGKIVSMKITPLQDGKKLLISLSDITKYRMAQETLEKSLVNIRELANRIETTANKLNGL
jgi:PAS domain S-box-containing protein